MLCSKFCFEIQFISVQLHCAKLGLMFADLFFYAILTLFSTDDQTVDCLLLYMHTIVHKVGSLVCDSVHFSSITLDRIIDFVKGLGFYDVILRFLVQLVTLNFLKSNQVFIFVSASIKSSLIIYCSA